MAGFEALSLQEIDIKNNWYECMKGLRVYT